MIAQSEAVRDTIEHIVAVIAYGWGGLGSTAATLRKSGLPCGGRGAVIPNRDKLRRAIGHRAGMPIVS